MRKTLFILILTLVFGSNLQAQQKVTVGINQQKTVVENKLTIKFASLVEDSRCPTDTNCIWAGNAKIKIVVAKTKSDSKTFELNTNGESQSVNFSGYEIKLVGLSPQPATNIRINRNRYTATFVVSKLTNTK